MAARAALRDTVWVASGRSPGSRVDELRRIAFPSDALTVALDSLRLAYRCGGSAGIVDSVLRSDAPASRFISRKTFRETPEANEL